MLELGVSHNKNQFGKSCGAAFSQFLFVFSVAFPQFPVFAVCKAKMHGKTHTKNTHTHRTENTRERKNQKPQKTKIPSSRRQRRRKSAVKTFKTKNRLHAFVACNCCVLAAVENRRAEKRGNRALARTTQNPNCRRMPPAKVGKPVSVFPRKLQRE